MHFLNTQSNFEVTSTALNGIIKIYVNSILLLAIIEFHNVIGIYNYYENGMSHIEIFYQNREKPIKLSFNKDEKWIKVINELCQYF